MLIELLAMQANVLKEMLNITEFNMSVLDLLWTIKCTLFPGSTSMKWWVTGYIDGCYNKCIIYKFKIKYSYQLLLKNSWV